METCEAVVKSLQFETIWTMITNFKIIAFVRATVVPQILIMYSYLEKLILSLGTNYYGTKKGFAW